LKAKLNIKIKIKKLTMKLAII